jgi:hypothetical protein
MMGSRKGGVAMKPSQLLKFAQLALQVARQHLPPYGSKYSPKKFTQPSLWACLLVKEYLRMDYRGLEDLLASSAELRAALGLVFDVPRVHAASGDPHVAEGGPGDDPAAVPEAFPTGGDGSRGCHGLFPAPGQPLLHEAYGASSTSEAVPDVVDGRVGPAPGHLCPGGSSRPREPVSVASAFGPGDGASCSRPASVGLCRLRFRADSSMAPGGAGYREHHPGHGVLSRTGPDPLPASDATLFPPPEIRSAVDRRDGRFGPRAEIWRGPDDPPLVAIGQAGSPAGLGLQPSADRCSGGDFLASLGSLPPPRGATVVRNAYGIPTPMRFFDRASEAYLRS